jgi:hypothetical protein
MRSNWFQDHAFSRSLLRHPLDRRGWTAISHKAKARPEGYEGGGPDEAEYYEVHEYAL